MNKHINLCDQHLVITVVTQFWSISLNRIIIINQELQAINKHYVVIMTNLLLWRSACVKMVPELQQNLRGIFDK